mmetsp:Transcript_22347/g.22649  ORF Transcript_22347/g.22649 Transcript_22347/m.22649 type:complete len:250 (-) Transcript_22347:228-977(-)
MAAYGKVEYWDERYTTERETFDWYQRYSGIRHFFSEKFLSPNKPLPPLNEMRALDIGCGTSKVSKGMVEDGFGAVTSVDFSKVVIDLMSDEGKKEENSKVKFELMDVTKQFLFDDKSFDLVFCKGTLDSILCGAGSVHNAKTMIKECNRVLTDSGTLVVVTYGNTDMRKEYFEDEEELGWVLDVHTIPKPKLNKIGVVEEKKDPNGPNHFVYICRKGAKQESEQSELSSDPAEQSSNTKLDGEKSANTP